MKKEEWKDIEGYEGKYQVSNKGRVRALNYNREGKVKVLKLMDCCGYKRIELRDNGKRFNAAAHRLVYEAFVGKIPQGYQVHHCNENKADNRVENLRAVTAKTNCNEGTRNERISKNSKKHMSKPLFLMEASYPWRELTFASSRDCGKFFNYNYLDNPAVKIHQAKKKGKNTISLRGVIYYFAQ